MTGPWDKRLILCAGAISLLSGGGAIVFNLVFDENSGIDVTSQVRGADLVLHPDMGGDQNVFVMLEIQERDASPRFAVHLEDHTVRANDTQLTVDPRPGGFPGLWQIGVYAPNTRNAPNAASSRSKFSWSSGVDLVLTAGGATAPSLIGWRVFSEKNRDESSDHVATRAQHRRWLSGFQIIAILGTVVASVAAVFKKEPESVPSVVEILVRIACKARTEVERERVALGEEVLRQILEKQKDESAALEDVGRAAGKPAGEVKVGYQLVRMRFLLAWRETDAIVNVINGPGASAGGHN